MDLERQVIQSNQDVHVCEYEEWNGYGGPNSTLLRETYLSFGTFEQCFWRTWAILRQASKYSLFSLMAGIKVPIVSSHLTFFFQAGSFCFHFFSILWTLVHFFTYSPSLFL